MKEWPLGNFFSWQENENTYTFYIYINICYIHAGICKGHIITGQGSRGSWSHSELCLPGVNKGEDSHVEATQERAVIILKTGCENNSMPQPLHRRESTSRPSSFKQQGFVALGPTEPLHRWHFT